MQEQPQPTPQDPDEGIQFPPDASEDVKNYIRASVNLVRLNYRIAGARRLFAHGDIAPRVAQILTNTFAQYNGQIAVLEIEMAAIQQVLEAKGLVEKGEIERKFVELAADLGKKLGDALNAAIEAARTPQILMSSGGPKPPNGNKR